MVYDNLIKYIGQSITYRELCEVLDLKYYTGGKSKQLQIEDISRYYELEKIKTKYLITSQRETVIEKQDKRKETLGNNSKYADDIETIMLYTLQNKKEFVCTISQALLLCNLVNKNYTVGRRDIPLTSKVLDLDIKNVYMFYDSTSRRLKDTFERALNRMRSKALLSYTKPMRVAYNDVNVEVNELGEPKLDKYNKLSYTVNEVHRDATKDEIDVILDCEANALNALNCEDKQQIFLSHLWNQFRSMVTKEINERLNIKYYYEAYDIVVNSKQVDRMIKKYEVRGSSEILNYNMLDSLITSIDKAKGKKDDDGNNKYSEKFISDTMVMIETVINSECKYSLSGGMTKYKKDIKEKVDEDSKHSERDDDVPF